MALKNSDLQILLDDNLTLSSVIGREKEFTFKIKNTSTTDTAYNTSLILTARDGIEIISTSLSATKIEKTVDYTSKFYFTNIEDFGPDEDYFYIKINLMVNEKYGNKSIIPFKNNILLTLQINADTMTEGFLNDNNDELINTFNFQITAEKLCVIKTVPEKALKGAGDGNSEATSSFDCITEIINNTREDSVFSIIETIADGLVYLNQVNYEGIDFGVPSILSDNNVTEIAWNNLTISKGNSSKIIYKVAIFDRYSEDGILNSGERISQGSLLNLSTVVAGNYIDYKEYRSVKAMDYMIILNQDKYLIDVDYIINFSGDLKTSEYVIVDNSLVNVIIPDGFLYTDAFNGVPQNLGSDYSQTILYNFDRLDKSSVNKINLQAKVVNKYQKDNSYLYSGDKFQVSCQISGIDEYDNTLTDIGNVNEKVILPSVIKELVSITDRNGNDKTNEAVTTLDIVKYRLTYNNQNIVARQKNIIIDDFFPSNVTLPTTNDIQIIQGADIAPESTNPNRLRWILGEITHPSNWIAEVSCEVSENAKDEYIYNLLKLTGENKHGITYSDRKLVSLKVGLTNIAITQNISNVDKNAIESSQEAVINVTVTNVQNNAQNVLNAYYFSITEKVPSGMIIVEDSFNITGTDNTPIFSEGIIHLRINNLAPDGVVNMQYKCRIADNLSPNAIFQLSANTTRAYTQEYIDFEQNIQYDISISSNTIVLKSRPAIFNCIVDKTQDNNIYYKSTIVLPKGTVISNYQLQNILSQNQRSHSIGTINSTNSNLIINKNKLDFPVISNAIAGDSDYNIIFNYSATALDDDSATNNSYFKYVNMFGQAVMLSASTDTSVTIVDSSSLKIELKSDTKSINDISLIDVQIVVTNNSLENTKNLKIELPLYNYFYYRDGKTDNGKIYSENSSIQWIITKLETNESATANAILIPGKDLVVKNSIDLKGFINSYTISSLNFERDDKIPSNDLNIDVLSNANLNIQKRYLKNGQGYVLVTKDKTKYVLYNIKNVSPGTDDFTIEFSETKYPLKIYANKIYIGDIAKGESRIFSSDYFIKIGSYKNIKLIVAVNVPEDTLYGDVNPVTITLRSLKDTSFSTNLLTEFVDP